MQKILTYYDNQSRQIYNIINPPAKYIYFQFPIESNVITNLKVHDKSTLFHVRETERKRERKKETEKESTSINYPDKSETSWTKRQKKEERNKKRDTKKKKKKEQYAKQRMQKCSAIAVDLSSNRINCDPRGGWMEHRCNDP